MKIPTLHLERLYARGSLANVAGGFRFALSNRLMDARLTGFLGLSVDGTEVPLDCIAVEFGDGRVVPASSITPNSPAPFAVREVARVRASVAQLADGIHEVAVRVDTQPFGTLELTARDRVASADAAPSTELPPPPAAEPIGAPMAPRPPYAKEPDADQAPELIRARQEFVERATGVRLRHVGHFSIDPPELKGNIEAFTGVAQVPIGIAGPIRVNGEHAQGDFYVPLATTEGTLVASYSRGMKVLSLAGGVTTTIFGDAMQRAPVFAFDSARDARHFADWIEVNLPEIRAIAESTSRVAKLQYVETYLASRFAYVRFDYATGDASGQNMVGKATLAACDWIVAHAPNVRRFFLESNFATDKKVSAVNVLRGRGKRVTAEATIPRALLKEHLHIEPETLQEHGYMAAVAAQLTHASSNGLHVPNALAAMFIACGQDVANVAEGAASVINAETTRTGDLYLSVTIPSLVVATYGGGTGLATQRECLEMMGCYGTGKVRKFTEIVAAVALAGELSLAAAISTLEWVSAHERYGRNR